MPLNLTKLLSYLEFGMCIAGWFDRNKSEEKNTSHPAAKQGNTENSFQLAQPTFLQKRQVPKQAHAKYDHKFNY